VSDDGFLQRWSRRKVAAREGREVEAEAPIPPPPPPVVQAVPPVAPAERSAEGELPESPLPPVESLTPASDFTPFMRPGVDGGVRREALKTLFSDPRFNVMDGLDVYIDDYSKPDPLPAGWLEKMAQVGRLGDFRLTEEGKVQAAREAEEARRSAALRAPEIAAEPVQEVTAEAVPEIAAEPSPVLPGRAADGEIPGAIEPQREPPDCMTPRDRRL
jgi:Protein of unknown function (DUF3306)